MQLEAMKKAAPAICANSTPTRGLRCYLYFTAAVTGAAVMIVEILGAKMLSPYVGASHFVWTAQIAITLVALACGYYVGGRLVDKFQQLEILYWVIFAAGVFLAITTLACERIAYWSLKFDLAIATLCASALLFFLPLALLAMTGPFLVRILTNSVSGVGNNVGRLTAISTLGSFVGTVLIGYILIPLLPNSTTMCGTAAFLILLGPGYRLGWRRKNVIAVSVVSAIGIALVALGTTANQHVGKALIERFHSNSPFGMIQVLDVKGAQRRYLLNDYLTQNIYDPEQNKSRTLFTYMLSGLARAYTTNVQDVLCIGLGVGVVPMDFVGEGANVDVVEINPAMSGVAEQFFDFKPEKLNLVIGDGRYYLNECQKKFDAVILDAFLGDSTPSHLMTREAFTAMHRVLRPGGVLVINSFGNLNSQRDFLASSLDKTLRAVFKNVRIHSNDAETLFFVAGDRPDFTILRPQSVEDVHSSVREDAIATYRSVIQVQAEHGKILTDDFNPAEFFDAQNREALRRELAMSMKRLE